MARDSRRTIHRAIPAALLALAVATAAWADFEERFEVAADTLVVRNLIGEITVEGHSGRDFLVEVRAQGRDATRGNLSVSLREGSRAELEVRFPVEHERRYVYPRMGRGSRTTIDLEERRGFGGLLSRIFGRGNIHVTGSGGGMEVWADVTVRVPRGAETAVELGVGRILATDLDGDADLRNRSGRIEARSIRGDLVVDTGSGSVVVEDVDGDVVADTGSGNVTLRRIRGNDVRADTGSGGIDLESVSARTLIVDTGSGGVSGRGLEADSATVDTGSGSVSLEFQRFGSGRFEVDTGSGGITIGLPEGASAEVSASTGSGRIRVDMPGVTMRRHDRNDAEFTIGGGAARMVLDTGSGGIRIKPSS